MTQTQMRNEQLIEIDPALIFPNPAQPRKRMGDQELENLANSIRQWGILQPVSVRARFEKGKTIYEVIAGERRMRAAILAGLTRIPCRIIRTDSEGSAEMAIVENLQRKDLDPFEEAEAIKVLLDIYHLTQENLAGRLSVSQSYIANKLRLLTLTTDEQMKILEHGLTERHARALIRIKDEKLRGLALSHIITQGYNVARTEAYIEHLLEQTTPPPPRKIKGAIKDLRLFYNSLDRALDILTGAGMKTRCKKRVTDEGVEVTIFIQK